MIIDLEQALTEGGILTLTFAEVVPSGADVAFPHLSEGEILVAPAGQTLLVTGEVATMVTLACSRCLRPFHHRLVATFSEGFRPGAPPVAAPGRRWLGGDDFVMPVDESRLDVTEVVRQHLLMALPMVPACRADCRGLCVHCGADRNEAVCGCAEEVIDSRLIALKGFPASGG